jgi:flagellar biosynthesis anti-sigma factor FlgM
MVPSMGDEMPSLPLTAAPGEPVPSGSASSEKPENEAKIQKLLDQIRSLDGSMDEARMKKIAEIKAALANGTYRVSAADVARKIIDQMREP